jgi:hypothetical protein
MVVKDYWDLDARELRLAERIFYKGGSVYVGPHGVVYEIQKENCVEVNSRHWDELRIFVDEVRSTKIIVDYKYMMSN